MKRSALSVIRRGLRATARQMLGLLPRESRFQLYRWLATCDPRPDADFELKIADTQEELEACFRILHDAYVAEGFMAPDPSGLRVTVYHALPTTTTLCAKYKGRVVGTISIIREGVFGFPLQTIFDLSELRASRGQIAEVSALAIDPHFRRTGGQVLFPLMKFMYEYCREYFDTRHIVIAVNPAKIELYESLLFFERLEAKVVDNYDFANGAPAVGASLDLQLAQERFRATYDGRPERKNLYRYFVENRMANIRWPHLPLARPRSLLLLAPASPRARAVWGVRLARLPQPGRQAGAAAAGAGATSRRHPHLCEPPRLGAVSRCATRARAG